MSGRHKRWWSPHLSFDGAYKETLTFLQKCREYQILAPQAGHYHLLHVHRVDGSWPLEGMQDIAPLNRFGVESSPDKDAKRRALCELLSAATRAHFFFDETAVVTHEPYLFSIPDLSLPGRFRYGLIYPLDATSNTSGQKHTSLIVTEWPLNLDAKTHPNIQPVDRYPVLLGPDVFTWLGLKSWRQWKKSGEGQPWFDRSWTQKSKSHFFEQLHRHTQSASFPYGTLLEHDVSLKEDAKLLGAMWAKGVHQWFLPHGLDAEVSTAYLKQLGQMTEAERWEQRWWTEQPKPRS